MQCYRKLRQNDILGRNKTAYRITVRQLESLVRLSEALARLHMEEEVKPKYVEEAYRLLQKSIIFVESEDIELDMDDNDGEGEEFANGLTAADGPDWQVDEELRDATGMGEDMTEEAEGASPLKRKAASLEGEPSDPAAQGPEEGRPDEEAIASKKEKKEKKKKTQISADKYRDITDMISLFLKQQDSVGGPDYQGTYLSDVVEWYLQQKSAELTDEETFNTQKKLVNQVIKRMIKHEGTLVEVDLGADGAVEYDKKLLKLHPSFSDII